MSQCSLQTREPVLKLWHVRLNDISNIIDKDSTEAACQVWPVGTNYKVLATEATIIILIDGPWQLGWLSWLVCNGLVAGGDRFHHHQQQQLQHLLTHPSSTLLAILRNWKICSSAFCYRLHHHLSFNRPKIPSQSCALEPQWHPLSGVKMKLTFRVCLDLFAPPPPSPMYPY